MKTIDVSTIKYPNIFVLVDDEDFEELNKWKWGSDKRGYARRNDKGKIIFMHSFLNKTPKGMVTDHIDRNPLNNQKNNLRTVPKSINSFNTGLWKHNKSGYKGVSWSKHAKKWLSHLQLNNKTIVLGYFKSKEEAFLARKEAEKKYAVS